VKREEGREKMEEKRCERDENDGRGKGLKGKAEENRKREFH
jgi:hypothetical protein